MKDSGRIEVIFGPMFSGKSSELLRKVRRFQHAKKKCLVVNYINDNRYSEEDYLATHDKYYKSYNRMMEKAVKTSNLNEIKESALKHDVVAIDEGQFFPNIVQFCQELANHGVIVMVAALDGTFQRKAFGNIINLIPIAEKVTKLSAVCVYCAKQAAFTKRTVESQEIELIAGEEAYKPVCRKCFIEENKQESETKHQEMSLNNPEKLEIPPVKQII